MVIKKPRESGSVFTPCALFPTRKASDCHSGAAEDTNESLWHPVVGAVPDGHKNSSDFLFRVWQHFPPDILSFSYNSKSCRTDKIARRWWPIKCLIKFPFYGSTRFTTVLRTTRCWMLCPSSGNQWSSHHFTIRCNLILSSHLCQCLPCCPSLSGLQISNVYTLLVPMCATCPA